MAPLSSLSVLSALALSLYTTCVTAEPGVVGLSFTKRQIADPASYPARRLRKRTGTAPATIYNSQGDLLYLINTTVGTPPQKIGLQLDTGSSDIWLPWTNSSICESKDDPCVNGAYDSTKSSTFEEVLPNEFQISYVDGTQITGDYINETFSMAGVTVKEMTMGVAKDANLPNANSDTPFQGIVGVGFDSGEAIVSQTQGQSEYPNVISQMVLQKLISTRAYSLWLNDLESSTGNILFGGVDDSKFNGALTILPLQADTQTNTIDTFTVTFAGLNITGNNGKVVYSTQTMAPVILDSGTSLTYLPDDIANAIATGVGAVNSATFGTVVPCSLANTQGLFRFQFGNSVNGPVIVAQISQFVIPYPAGFLAPKFKNGQAGCQWGILPADGNPNLFGDTFLRSAYVVYNIEGNQVGIAQTNFNVTDTQIKQITATSSLPGATSTASGSAQQTAGGPIFNTNGGEGLGGGASTTVAATGTGTFDLGTGTATVSGGTASTASSSSSKQGAAPGLSAPSTPFVGAIVTAVTVLFAVLGGSMIILA